MTPKQFWDDDCQLARYYREAEHHREDKFNRQAHLQGMYIYEALCDVAPILHAFADKGTKANPYPDKPYELTYIMDDEGSVENEVSAKKTEEDIAMERNLSRMEAFAIEFNRNFRNKKMKEEMTNG